MASCKLLAVLVLVHNFEGLLGAEVKSSIIGGNDAKEGKWKWMVQLNLTTDDITTWGCGGTILNDQWVLTAASCWDKEEDWRRSMVVVGARSLDEEARYMAIKHFIKHPEYRSFHGGSQNNIALIQLKKKLKPEHVTPVTLPNANEVFDESSECWVTGWGKVGRNELPAPKTLQEVKLPIVRADVCKSKYNWLTSDVLCVGGKLGGIGACKGDEGGPLVCKTARGYVQAGIVSFGSAQGCGLPKEPSVYTRVSKYLTFINGYIHRGEEASAEV
ncbi:tryptase-2-like [Scomber japonicus]|uniref:tryptase-2-like n=1 Tax=Scomber japonicus TaxID=13676 RepID=UPI002306A098|nr:tryptase-2-like [Scomber japonicus]